MASDHDTITIRSSSVQDYHNNDDDGDEDHLHSHHLSRLSMCNNTITNNVVKHSSQVGGGNQEHDEKEEDMGTYISRLSIEGEGSDGDADEEFSDSKEENANKGRRGGRRLDSVLSSDSDREIGCLSLPATPPRIRTRRGFTHNQSSSNNIIGAKEYASDNEAAPHKGSSSTSIFRNNSKMRGDPKSRRSSFFNRERWFERANWERKTKKMQNDDNIIEHENDQCLIMITRPKGGSRSLCMDFEEVKACKDLGFELEHERLEIPSGISISTSSMIDTSSGGNSPIASWRVSSPGDDPRDVKARLKVWAQAVALVSSSPPRQA